MKSISAPKPAYYRTVHDGLINTVQRSPFFSDVLLCVGGWTFSVWKEGEAVSDSLHLLACRIFCFFTKISMLNFVVVDIFQSYLRV